MDLEINKPKHLINLESWITSIELVLNGVTLNKKIISDLNSIICFLSDKKIEFIDDLRSLNEEYLVIE